MEFLRAEGPDLLFQFTDSEKGLFLQLANLYPVLPAAYHRLTKEPAPAPLQEAQKLLEEAMAEQRQESQAKLVNFLKAEGRFAPSAKGHRLRLHSADLEWLLQVLNDIRVGSWVMLGSPDENSGRLPSHDPNLLPYLVAMESCAFFEMLFLKPLR